jgi:membrane-associated protease RseP (regulator of RpoE activity)
MATRHLRRLRRLFSPEASNLSASSGPTTVAGTPAQPNVLTPIGEAPGPSAATAAESARPVSIVGIVQVGSGAAEQGIWQFLMLLAVVNFALALINLLPVLPFDGGHAVIAGYEGIRGSIRHERYQADLTKMMPIVYGVFARLLVLGLSSIVLDLMHPVNYGP